MRLYVKIRFVLYMYIHQPKPKEACCIVVFIAMLPFKSRQVHRPEAKVAEEKRRAEQKQKSSMLERSSKTQQEEKASKQVIMKK